MTVKGKTVELDAAKVKAAAQKISRKKAIKVSSAKGDLSFKKSTVYKWDNSKGKYVKNSTAGKKLTCSKSTGKITVKKGTKAGKYKVKIKVTAEGNSSYKSKTKTVAVKIIIVK